MTFFFSLSLQFVWKIFVYLQKIKNLSSISIFPLKRDMATGKSKYKALRSIEKKKRKNDVHVYKPNPLLKKSPSAESY